MNVFIPMKKITIIVIGALAFCLLSFFVLTRFTTISWLGNSNSRERIIGIWETNQDPIVSSKILREQHLENVYSAMEHVLRSKQNSQEQIAVTFHRDGQITSQGKVYGSYRFSGDQALKYMREGARQDYYVTVKFPSDADMIWRTLEKIQKATSEVTPMS